MAKIHEEVLVIKLSKLVKEQDSEHASLASEDVVVALEQVAQELVGGGVIVEVERA